MVLTSFDAVEIVAFGLAVCVFYDAYREGRAKIMTCIGAMTFGLIVEMFFVTSYAGYSYGDFVIDFYYDQHTVPLWVAVGWGTIIYVAMTASDKMNLPWFLAPAVDGLLAVSLDVTIDPVAEALGWWHWHDGGEFFGVPYDNFIGWVMIVSFYSFAVRAGFRLWPPTSKLREFFVPFVAVIPALVGVAAAQILLDQLYPRLGQAQTFALVVFVLAAIAMPWLVKVKPRPAVPWYLLGVPLGYHLLAVSLFFGSGMSQTHPELVLFMLVAPIASLALFLHASATILRS